MFSLSRLLDFQLDSPWEAATRIGAPRHPLRPGHDEDQAGVSPPDAKSRREVPTDARSAFTALPGGSSGTTGATASAAKPTPAWRNGSTGSWSNAPAPSARGHVCVQRVCCLASMAEIHEFGQLNFDELHAFPGQVRPTGRGADAGRQVLGEVRGRLELLLGIGLDYLSFNRRSATLSGGESQRIRLSTQIGSGLMGMLYVLDEPSIGLHPKDNVKMIATLEPASRYRQHRDRSGTR